MFLVTTELYAITGHFVINWIIVGLAVIGILFLLSRWIKKVTCQNDSAFIQAISEDIATWLDSQGLMNKDIVQTELQSVFNGEPSDSFREQLLRFECRFLQTSPSICQMTTTIIFKKKSDIRETSFTKNVNWDTLPADVRKEFIMNNKQEITYDFLKQKGKM